VRQLEEQNTALRDAFRLREEVERIARHDLKTPLASIASVPRLLRERRALDAGEDELLGTVERAALRVLSMVNLSLDLYRMEEGTYRLRAQAVDLAAWCRRWRASCRRTRARRTCGCVLDLPAQPLYAQGEELLCYSTVANLLKNALEASPDGADVRVTVRRERRPAATRWCWTSTTGRGAGAGARQLLREVRDPRQAGRHRAWAPIRRG
jgi:signal transduction histidine kinase